MLKDVMLLSVSFDILSFFNCKKCLYKYFIT